MIEKQTLHGEDMIVQSNNLVEAVYDSDLTATEHKILRYAASKIKNNPDNFPRVSFSVTEFREAAGLKGNNYHAQMIKIADELTRKRIKIQSDQKTGWFPWLSALVYDEGVVHLAFNTLIKDMLLELDGQFTRYSYGYIGDMRSGYSIRLFELLKQYASIGRRRVELDVLRKMLGTGDKHKQYGQFKLRVLNQAKKELDRKKELTFEFEEVKQGRKVVAIIFFIKVNNPKILLTREDLPRAKNETFIKEAKYLLESYNLKISDKILSSWSKYGINTLSKVLEEVKDRNMKSPAAYIKTVLESMHQESEEIKSEVKTDNNEIKESIALFIMDSKASKGEMIPDWFMKKTFVEYMVNSYTSEEIEEMWEKNKDYIIKMTHPGDD